ncbi:Sec-independent protein translocase protein TatB [Arenibaculum pallidiluteum]|uniref:Sec-independent protein translocase protein TatB n=1 Tax=Arenibaculum pallidiluteum TaxID=2812559 RepID=UPI001A971F6C|nr:Sec-independent protein translocase protein TatB [Arenibaculum pallidiluteum]
MLDIGWSELALIAVVALVVIGPKDLPQVLKTVGLWVRKARMLTREFQGHIDDMIREAELEDVRKKALELKDMNLARQVENTIDPTGSLRTAFEMDPAKPATAPAPAAAEPATASLETASIEKPAALPGAVSAASASSAPASVEPSPIHTAPAPPSAAHPPAAAPASAETDKNA